MKIMHTILCIIVFLLLFFVPQAYTQEKYQYISTQDFSGGLNLSLSPSQIAPNQAQVLENALWDKQGSINLRNGFVKMNSTKIAGKPIRGLYRYYLPDGTKQTLVACSTIVWKDSAGTFVNALVYKEGQIIHWGSADTIRGIGTSFYEHLLPNDKILIDGTYKTVKKIYSNNKLQLTSNASSTDTVSILAKREIDSTQNVFFAYADGNIYIFDGVNAPFKYDGTTFWRSDICDKGLSTYSTNHGGSFPDSMQDKSKSWSENEWVGYLLVGIDSGTVYPPAQLPIVANNESTLVRNRYAVNSGSGYLIISIPTVNSYVDTGTIVDMSIFHSPYTSPDYIICHATVDFIDLFGGVNAKQYWFFIDGGYFTGYMGGIYGNSGSYPESTVIVHPYPDPNGFDTLWIGDKYKIGAMTIPYSDFGILFQNKLCMFKNPLHPSRFWFSKDNWYENFDPLNFKNIETNDGDYITGGTVLGEVLLVFKNNHTFQISTAGRTDFFGTEAGSITYLEISNRVGCVAPKTAVTTPAGAFFLHYSGIYWTNGQEVKLVSNNIKPIIDSIPRLYVHKASAGYYNDHYYISFPQAGDTLNTTTYAMNIYNGAWSKETSLKKNFAFSCYASMDAYSDTIGMMMGDPDSGMVYYYDVGNVDIDSPIVLSYQSPSFDVQAPHLKKVYDKLTLDVEGDTNFYIQYFYDYNDTARFTDTLSLLGEKIIDIYPNAEVIGNNGSWKLTTKRGMTDFKLNKAVWKFKVRGEL